MSNIGNKKTFSKNLAYYLERCGKDQKEVAEIIGVAASTFNEWVKGKKYPRIDKIEMLSNFFGILKSDLIEEKDSPRERLLSEGELKWLELYRRISPESREMLITTLEGLDRLSPEKQKLAADLLRVAIGQK